MQEQAVSVARAHLAAALGVAPDAFVVAHVEAVTWRDSGLGCREPGMMYMQVLTPGFRITFTHHGTPHIVHTDQGRRAVHCNNPQTPFEGDALA